jgi:hypothetical protein
MLGVSCACVHPAHAHCLAARVTRSAVRVTPGCCCDCRDQRQRGPSSLPKPAVPRKVFYLVTLICPSPTTQQIMARQSKRDESNQQRPLTGANRYGWPRDNAAGYDPVAVTALPTCMRRTALTGNAGLPQIQAVQLQSKPLLSRRPRTGPDASSRQPPPAPAWRLRRRVALAFLDFCCAHPRGMRAQALLRIVQPVRGRTRRPDGQPCGAPRPARSWRCMRRHQLASPPRRPAASLAARAASAPCSTAAAAARALTARKGPGAPGASADAPSGTASMPGSFSRAGQAAERGAALPAGLPAEKAGPRPRAAA